jgi:hypothetical protein
MHEPVKNSFPALLRKVIFILHHFILSLFPELRVTPFLRKQLPFRRRAIHIKPQGPVWLKIIRLFKRYVGKPVKRTGHFGVTPLP